MWWTTLSMGSEAVLHTISRTHANAIHIRVTRTSVWTAYAWPARASPAAPLLRLVPVCENSFTGPPPAVSSTGSAHHTGTSNVSLAAALGAATCLPDVHSHSSSRRNATPEKSRRTPALTNGSWRWARRASPPLNCATPFAVARPPRRHLCHPFCAPAGSRPG